ncbi:hypothetical protein [Amycolatopsis sp. NPDC021455]|uniref:hypothetical protein n=1 Tax=Amycolatopsis sp. NPDC021455 TaxID=3154901 RepID=UPI0033FCE564
MNQFEPSDVVDQLFFGWSPSGGQKILADSFDSLDEVDRWSNRLKTHVRLHPVPGTELPREALSYFSFDDSTAAVLRRVAGGPSSARNYSHAMVGSVAALDFPVALSLQKWRGWREIPPPDERMNQLPARTLSEAAVAANDRLLRPRAMHLERRLVLVLSRLLDDPGRPLSIIGCPAEDRLAIVWGLREAADDHLRSLGWGARRWSFSTYEHKHDVSRVGLPEVVFLPANPVDAAVVDRTTVDLGGELPENSSSVLAGQLVAHVFRGTPRPAITPVSSRPGKDTLSPPTRPTQATSYEPPGAVDGSWPQGQARREPGHRGLGHLAKRGGDEQIRALLTATSVREFEERLCTLEAAAGGPQARAMLRSALDVDAVDSATRFAEVTAREEFFGRLLQAAYGKKFEDLREPAARDHAAELVLESRSDQLAMMVGEYAVKAGSDRKSSEKLRDAAFRRWVAAGRSEPLPPTGSIARALQAARRGARLPVAIVIATLTLAAAVFLAGILVERPAATVPAVNNAVPAPTPATTSAPPSPAPSIVYLFRDLGNGTYEPLNLSKQRTPPANLPYVAIAIPADQLDQVQKKAGQNEGGMTYDPRWGPIMQVGSVR